MLVWQRIRRVTRLLLESELYQLTAVGGPRYLPRSVNSAAFRALVPAMPVPLPVEAPPPGLTRSILHAVVVLSSIRSLPLCRTSCFHGASGHGVSSAGWPASSTPQRYDRAVRLKAACAVRTGIVGHLSLLLTATIARLPAVALDVGRRSAAGSRHSAVVSALRMVLAACVVQLLDARHRLLAAAVDTAA